MVQLQVIIMSMQLLNYLPLRLPKYKESRRLGIIRICIL